MQPEQRECDDLMSDPESKLCECPAGSRAAPEHDDGCPVGEQWFNTYRAPAKQQVCGHPTSAVVSTDEGTAYCGTCAIAVCLALHEDGEDCARVLDDGQRYCSEHDYPQSPADQWGVPTLPFSEKPLAEQCRIVRQLERDRVVRYLRLPAHRGMWNGPANAIERGEHHEH